MQESVGIGNADDSYAFVNNSVSALFFTIQFEHDIVKIPKLEMEQQLRQSQLLFLFTHYVLGENDNERRKHDERGFFERQDCFDFHSDAYE